MGTHFHGTEDDRRTLDAYIKLIRASDSVLSHVSKTFNIYHLTLSQFGVLDALYHIGPMCQSQLAHKILRTSGNMTMVVDNLERRGLVKRVRDTEDRRKFTVELTEKGNALIGEAFPSHLELIREAFSGLSDEEQRQLSELSRKLGLAIADRNTVPA